MYLQLVFLFTFAERKREGEAFEMRTSSTKMQTALYITLSSILKRRMSGLKTLPDVDSSTLPFFVEEG